MENTQDAVYWVNLAQAQDEGLRFWQTTTNAIISLCCQIALTKQFLKKGKELYSRDPRRLVPQRRLYLRVLGNRSSSSKTPLRVRLPAPEPGKWCRECTERNKVTQQINQNYPAPGNWSEVLSHVLRKPEFKVDLRIEGIAQDVILKDEEWMGKIQEVVRAVRLGTDDPNRPVSLMLETFAGRFSLLFLWRLSCSNESLKEQETRRDSVATRPLESIGCQKRSMEKL